MQLIELRRHCCWPLSAAVSSNSDTPTRCSRVQLQFSIDGYCTAADTHWRAECVNRDLLYFICVVHLRVFAIRSAALREESRSCRSVGHQITSHCSCVDFYSKFCRGTAYVCKMRPFAIVLVASVFATALAACPNQCSGHGWCDENDRCICFRAPGEWTSCDSRREDHVAANRWLIQDTRIYALRMCRYCKHPHCFCRRRLQSGEQHRPVIT